MKLSRVSVVVLGVMLLGVGIAVAAEKVFIRDIQADPAKYLNIPVVVRGEVVQVTSEGQPTRGTYMLRDEGDRTIVIRSRDLPAPGRTVVVEGRLSQDPGVTTYHLREEKRCEPGLLSLCDVETWWLAAVIGAAVIVAGLIVVLVLILMKPAVPVTATVPMTTGAISEKTRAVTTEDLRKLSPPAQRTVQLPTMPAQVEVLSGPKTGTRFVLKQETTFGRGDGDLPLEDATVSTEHAKIRFENKSYRLINRSLTNPTRVNGQPIEGVLDLKDGDELLMGAVKLKFSLLK